MTTQFKTLRDYQTECHAVMGDYQGTESSITRKLQGLSGEFAALIDQHHKPDAHTMLTDEDIIRKIGTIFLYASDIAALRREEEPELMYLDLSTIMNTKTFLAISSLTKNQAASELCFQCSIFGMRKAPSSPTLLILTTLVAYLAILAGSSLQKVLATNVAELTKPVGYNT